MIDEEMLKYFRIEAAELLDRLYRGVLQIERGERFDTVMEELRRTAHSLKGAARLVELWRIGDLAHRFEDELALWGAAGVSTGEVSSALETIDEIRDELVREGTPSPTVETPVVKLLPWGDATTRVQTSILDEFSRRAAEVREIAERGVVWRAQAQRVSATVARAIHHLEGVRAHVPSHVFHEAELARAMIRDLRESLDLGLQGLDSLGRSLHSLSLRTKLVPAEEVAHRFEKLVRDTAHETGKRAELLVEGAEVRIDQMVLQRMIEPLSHLVRNAVCHGIERPEERTVRGKPAAGTVRLSFSRSVEHVQITVEDDGKGIDFAALRAVNGDGHRSDDELIDLLFHPGVSTQHEVTALAGRGVGLDVLKRAVDDLRGVIDVATVTGRSCTFVVRLPSSLDLMDVIVVWVSDQRFLISLDKVSMVARTEDSRIEPHGGRVSFFRQGRPLSIARLDTALGLPDGRGIGSGYVIVLRGRAGEGAVLVDRIEGRHRVVIKSAGRYVKRSPFVSGAAIMVDGRVAVLLDSDTVLERVRERGTLHSAGTSEPVVRSVLVVDDSLTTRMLEKAVLESAGYRTTLATGSEEALELMKEGSFDLFVVDFEMPGMDGMELTRRIRESARFAHTPVIMLTSRGDDDDRRAGLSAGVQAYLVKGRFDQSEFLGTVEQLIGGSA
jgi:two-component system, chemotaxis family, sensor kinase CheA